MDNAAAAGAVAEKNAADIDAVAAGESDDAGETDAAAPWRQQAVGAVLSPCHWEGLRLAGGIWFINLFNISVSPCWKVFCVGL